MGWFSNLYVRVKRLFVGNVDVSKLVLKIQAAVVRSCGYLPMAETIVALVLMGNPAVTVVSAVANKVCAAVKKPPSLLTSGLVGGEKPKPTVDGVEIEGEWIK